MYETLVVSALAGDRSALEALVDAYQGVAVGYAVSLVGDYHLAEDMAQEAFIRALKSLPSLQNPAAFPSWFRTIIRFTCIRHLRKRRPHIVPLDHAAEASGGEDPLDALQRSEAAGALRAAIDALPEEDRSILLMTRMHRATYQQVADFLGIPRARVANRLHAVRRGLRKELGDTMDDNMQGLPGTPSKRFHSRVIQGVERVGYVQGDTWMLTTFCGCFTAWLSAVTEQPPLDYAAVCAVSGAAFRMVWKEGWRLDNVALPMAMEDPFAPFFLAAEAAGCNLSLYRCDNGGAYTLADGEAPDPAVGLPGKSRAEATAQIMASIDEGFPVLALGIIGPPECAIITGYAADGAELLGYSYFQNDMRTDDIWVDDQGLFHRRAWFDNTAVYMLLRPRPGYAGFDLRATGLAAARLAVDMAHTPQVQGRAAGLSAYVAMAQQVLHDEEYTDIPTGDQDMVFSPKADTDPAVDITGRIAAYWDPMQMTGERANAARFFDALADLAPPGAAHLRQAAAHYRLEAANPHPTWEALGIWQDMERFRDPRVRSELAAQVLRWRYHEERAVRCLTRFLAEASAWGLASPPTEPPGLGDG